MKCKILEVIYEFHNNDYKTTNGLYHVELSSGNKYYYVRNNDSVGAIQHYLGKSASECVGVIRKDRKDEFFKELSKTEGK